jgi:hypothetical protein
MWLPPIFKERGGNPIMSAQSTRPANGQPLSAIATEPDEPFLTKEQARQYVNEIGCPVSKSTWDKWTMPSNYKGPPITAWWGPRPLYHKSSVRPWTFARLRRFKSVGAPENPPGAATPVNGAHARDVVAKSIEARRAKGAMEADQAEQPSASLAARRSRAVAKQEERKG